MRKGTRFCLPKLSILSCVLLVSLGNVGCSNELEFVRKTVIDSVSLSEDSSVPTCSYSIDFMYARAGKSDQITERINTYLVEAVFSIENLSPAEAVDSFANRFIADYRRDVSPFYLVDKQSPNHSLRGWYNYETNISTSVNTSYGGDVLNYQVEEESYLGGAHGNYRAKWINFRKEDGTVISLDEIMQIGYQSKLTELLIKALEEKCNVNSIEELREKGYLNWSEMFPSPNFFIKDDGIDFLYNPYEIAPWSMGRTELTISNKKLKRLLKPIEEWM